MIVPAFLLIPIDLYWMLRIVVFVGLSELAAV